MKKEIFVYTNIKKYSLFEQILSKYNVNFRTLDELKTTSNFQIGGIILLSNNEKNQIVINSFPKNFLLITTSTKHLDKSDNNKIHLLKPINVNQFNNYINNFLSNNNLKFNDICIHDKKLININSNLSCFLTDIEKDILFYLINNDKCNKNYIREKILNIKSNIETNSIESHLTRIRKKIEKINSKLIIQSKNESITIFAN